MNQPVYKLKVTLRGIRPAIWRRLEVPADLSLLELHRVLQEAMGWSESHLHQFLHRGIHYGAPDYEYGTPVKSERRTRLSDLLGRVRDRLIYEYDFGDSWEHDVVLESISEAEPGLRYPRVIAGKRACPPEDVGGYPGYEEFVRVITDPGHDEHESMLAWAGGQFDPEKFDLIAANDRVPKRRASARRNA
ncbi:MAG: plasmid pRiA4b ORF-3 family protein [Gemmatimonadaceae bacterium]